MWGDELELTGGTRGFIEAHSDPADQQTSAAPLKVIGCAMPWLTMGTRRGVPMVLAAPNDLLGLAVAEGAEEALTVHQFTGVGAWASGGASRLPALAARLL